MNVVGMVDYRIILLLEFIFLIKMFFFIFSFEKYDVNFC